MADFEGDKSCGPTHHACDCFLERVARLEERNAALDAALRRYGGHGMDCVWTHKDKQHCACGFLAALTDTGEGWLPPELARKLLEYSNHQASCILDHHAPGVRDCGCGYVEVLRAALAVLEVK